MTSEPNVALSPPTRFAAPSPSAGLNAGALAVLGLVGIALLGITVVMMNQVGESRDGVGYVLLADLAYVVLLLGLIARRVWRLLTARRDHEAGSKLHLRLTAIFSLVASVPTVIVAAFATLSLNIGIETWFSQPVGSVVRNSLATAQAYAEEHRRTIQGQVLNMANDLNRQAFQIPYGALRDVLQLQQRARQFPEAYLIDGSGEILHRGEFSYTFTYERPTEVQMASARGGNVVVVEDQENNELRALVALTNYIDMFLLVSRQVDGDVLNLLDETEETVRLYNQTEATRGQFLSVFALIYLAFALLVIATAAWLGLWLAERLSRPIGVLAAAAERVGHGDLDIKVPVEGTGDEVSLLSRVFNRMTAQVKDQRDDLIRAREESEERRNFIETVLSGVSAGVVGLDSEGGVEMSNAAARRMIGDPSQLPEAMNRIFAAARTSLSGAAQGQVTVDVDGEAREFLVRVAARSSADAGLGYVMTLDDLTALVSAQREAAWGDVARRIAHEIKNPLTPIQLSAERLRRKFAKIDGVDQASIEQYTDVIVRQAGDIRRMVDEFSKFARMPTPVLAREDASSLLRDAVLLQRAANVDVSYSVDGADEPVMVRCDAGMVTQAFTNILKNAAEAIEGRLEADPDAGYPGRIEALIEADGARAVISVTDNGVGLPANRAELMEPYVTTRAKGTGLGLAIVKKIAEQHGGEVKLEAATPVEGERPGARISITLPLAPEGAAAVETAGKTGV